MFHTVIVEYIIHSDIPNYTKLAFSSLKMIRNDTVSQPIKRSACWTYPMQLVVESARVTHRLAVLIASPQCRRARLAVSTEQPHPAQI